MKLAIRQNYAILTGYGLCHSPWRKGLRMVRAAFVSFTVAALMGSAGAAVAASPIQPHRALYSLALDHSQSGSGIVGAGGQLYFEWADTCDGWAVEQRYKLRLSYTDADDSELQISLVSWEAKNGQRYRFEVKKLSNGEADEEIRGTAQLPKGKRGTARFTAPESARFPLPKDALFPSAHTIALIEAAKAGQNFLVRPVFDGGSVEGASTVAAAIGQVRLGDSKEANPLLKGRSWAMRMAFFPDSTGVDPRTQGEELPDYELGTDLLENGVSRSMSLDYGSFAVKAKLLKVEPLTAPKCS